MTPEQFCYWLQGRAETQPDNPPTAEEWQMIRDHLATVFNKVTPFYQPARYVTPGTPGDPVPPYRVECMADQSVTYPPIDTKTREQAIRRFIGGPWGGFPIPQPR